MFGGSPTIIIILGFMESDDEIRKGRTLRLRPSRAFGFRHQIPASRIHPANTWTGSKPSCETYANPSAADWKNSTGKPTTYTSSYHSPRPSNSAISSTASRESAAATCAATTPNSPNTTGRRNDSGQAATTREPTTAHHRKTLKQYIQNQNQPQ